MQLLNLVSEGQAAIGSDPLPTAKLRVAVMSYRQLTPAQRYQIYALMKADWTQLAMALEVGVHPATISRELSRNRGGRGYRPKQAQALAQARKAHHLTLRIYIA